MKPGRQINFRPSDETREKLERCRGCLRKQEGTSYSWRALLNRAVAELHTTLGLDALEEEG